MTAFYSSMMFVYLTGVHGSFFQISRVYFVVLLLVYTLYLFQHMFRGRDKLFKFMNIERGCLEVEHFCFQKVIMVS